MDWETERRSVYDSFMDMDHSSAVGCGDCRGSALSSYENKRLTVEYYEIESEKIPEAFDGYRIVFLTDLHCAQFERIIRN